MLLNFNFQNLKQSSYDVNKFNLNGFPCLEFQTDLGPVYMEGGCPGLPSYPVNRATRGGLTSHTFLSKTNRSFYMLEG